MVRLALVVAAALLAACTGGTPATCTERPPCDPSTDLACLDGCRMKADVAALASPALGGRGTGTDGNDAAAALVAARLEGLGLAPSPAYGTLVRAFTMDAWHPTGPAALAVDGTDLPFEGVFHSASADRTGGVVFAGHGITVPPHLRADWPACPFAESGYDDFEGLDVAGTVVVLLRSVPRDLLRVQLDCPSLPSLCPPGSPCHVQVWTKLRNAAARGAAAVILVNRPEQPSEPPRFVRGLSWAETGADGPAAMPVLWADRDALEAALPGLVGWSAAIDATLAPQGRPTGAVARVAVSAAQAPREIPQVVGVLPGTDLAGEAVLVGAHLDHMGTSPFTEVLYPGADDDASGVAVVLELARAFAARPTPPRRTLLFAAWNAEELGLVGSCLQAERDPAWPLDRTVAAVAVDMVGQGNGRGLELYGTEPDREPDVVRVVAEAGAASLPSLQVTAGGALERSDHVCFSYGGVPAVLAITPTFAHHVGYHTPADVPSLVTPANLEAAARLLYLAVARYADGAEGSPASPRPAPRRAPPSARVADESLRR